VNFVRLRSTSRFVTIYVTLAYCRNKEPETTPPPRGGFRIFKGPQRATPAVSRPDAPSGHKSNRPHGAFFLWRCALASRRTQPLPKGWQRTRRRILRRDSRRCYRCGGEATEVDHVRPASQGGTDDHENLAAICSECHAKKTAAEANQAKPKRRREGEEHPGLLP